MLKIFSFFVFILLSSFLLTVPSQYHQEGPHFTIEHEMNPFNFQHHLLDGPFSQATLEIVAREKNRPFLLFTKMIKTVPIANRLNHYFQQQAPLTSLRSYQYFLSCYSTSPPFFFV